MVLLLIIICMHKSLITVLTTIIMLTYKVAYLLASLVSQDTLVLMKLQIQMDSELILAVWAPMQLLSTKLYTRIYIQYSVSFWLYIDVLNLIKFQLYYSTWTLMILLQLLIIDLIMIILTIFYCIMVTNEQILNI